MGSLETRMSDENQIDTTIHYILDRLVKGIKGNNCIFEKNNKFWKEKWKKSKKYLAGEVEYKKFLNHRKAIPIRLLV